MIAIQVSHSSLPAQYSIFDTIHYGSEKSHGQCRKRRNIDIQMQGNWHFLDSPVFVSLSFFVDDFHSLRVHVHFCLQDLAYSFRHQNTLKTCNRP